MVGKLGRAPVKTDPRTLALRSVLPSRNYPAPPMFRDYLGDTKFSWFLNDNLGCCTITSIAHYLQLCGALRGETVTISDAEIETAYRVVSGYDPAKPETDRGAPMLDALVYARNVGIGRYKIGGFARFDVTDRLEWEAVNNHFGCAIIGSRLPRRILAQGTEWYAPPIQYRGPDDAPNSLGGHAYISGGYSHRKTDSMPWISKTGIQWGWHDIYTDEGYAIFDDAWVTGDRPAPNGFSMEALRSYLAAL